MKRNLWTRWNRGIAWLLGLAMLMSLMGCTKDPAENTEPLATETTVEDHQESQGKQEETEEASAPQIDPDVYMNLVTDAYVDAFLDEDDSRYCYHIPQFNLDSARDVNQEIYDYCEGILKQDVYEMMDEYGYPDVGNMVYIWGYYEDLASILIQTDDVWVVYTEYSAHTISVATGQAVSEDQLLASFGLDREEFHDLVKDHLEQYWDDYGQNCEEFGSDFYEDRVSRTLDDSNVRQAVPFINPDGGLSFVVNIYSLVAGDSYWHVMNAEGPLEMEILRCAETHTYKQQQTESDPLRYFVENCDRQRFTASDVQEFDEDMCWYARNAIFAKSGRKFQNETLQKYFAQFSWYSPRIDPDDFTDDMLNSIQLDNLEVVQKREQTFKSDSKKKLSFDEARAIAYKYWDYHEGDVASETGYELYVTDGGTMDHNGRTYYLFLLRWLVTDDSGNGWLSTLDQVYIDAVTGECHYSIY